MDTCKSCGAKIIWAKTESGKSAPFEEDPEGDHVIADGIASRVLLTIGPVQRFVSHFARCPNASRHRKKKPAG